MIKIFISYRRSDSLDITGRIYDHLCNEFKQDQIFRDVDSIPAGEDFRANIEKAVAVSDVFIAIIGNGWMKAKNSTDAVQLDDPDDFVRLEIEGALARRVPIIPVLIGGAKIPSPEALPASLRPVLFHQAIEVRPDPDFRNDIRRLFDSIRKITNSCSLNVPKPRTPIYKSPAKIAAIAALLSLLLLSGIYLLRAPDSLIQKIVVTSNRTYTVSRLEEGSAAFTDRSARFTNVPAFLKGQSYIVTPNEDKCPDDPAAFYLTFDVTRQVIVYVAHDDRYTAKPLWMSDFEKTNESITLTIPDKRIRYSLYRKNFSPGVVTLKNNIDKTCAEEGNFAMYTVIVAPA